MATHGTNDLKATTKGAASSASRGIIQPSVRVHPKEKQTRMRLKTKMLMELGVMVGPVQGDGCRYTSVIDNKSTIMRIMDEVSANAPLDRSVFLCRDRCRRRTGAPPWTRHSGCS